MGLRQIFRIPPLNILFHKVRRLRDRLFPPRPRAQAFSPPITPEPAVSPEPVASAIPQDAPFPERLRSFRQGLSELLAPIQARPRYVPAGRIRKWRKHIPIMARTCADVMEGAEALFTGFRFTGQHLRELEKEVHQLGLFLVFLTRAQQSVSALYGNRKQELVDKTMQVADQVRVLQDMPVVSAELRDLAIVAGRPIEALRHKSNQRALAVRRHRARIKADTEARVDSGKRDVKAAQLENQVLRGASLSAEALAQVVGPAE